MSLPTSNPPPALGAELSKAEARQANNLCLTGKAIDDLADLIANAKRNLDERQRAKGSGKSSGKSPPKTPSQAAAQRSPSKSPSVIDSASPCSSSASMRSPMKTPSLKSPSKAPYSPQAAAGVAAEGVDIGAEEMDLEDSKGDGRGGGDGGGGGAGGEVILAELVKGIERLKPVESVASGHKNFHATISKLAKAAEKHFGGDVESIRRTPALNQKALHTAIITHLYRKGAFRSAAKLAEDSPATVPADTRSQLLEMHGVLEALNKQNLGPADRWFEKRRTALEGVGSSLEFQLARLRFLCFLKGADPQLRREAMQFARDRLAPLAEAHMREIQELMGSLLWAGRLEESPYSHLLSADLWTRVKEAVVVDGSRVSGLSRESILSVAFRAGVLALPTLVKMATVVRGSNKEWDGMQELPLEVPLPPGMRYHSMFSCPVSREPSTPENPPVLLKCGHAVLRSSVSRLARNGSKFKCPTCPMEQMESDTMVLTL
ncbi:unnamed protein product [Laminaria digitata]